MTDGSKSSRRRRPLITGVVVIIVCAAMLATGWVLASTFRSPAQLAAEAAAPEPSTITAPVTRGTLSDSITVQGQVAASGRTSVAIGAGEGAGVVTDRLVAEGGDVAAGDVVLEVSNAPVFAMPGSFPFFRDIADGDTGRDVEQLQVGLQSAGFEVVVDGVYGPGTQAAVRGLFERAGYEAPTMEVAAESPTEPGDDAGESETPDDAQTRPDGDSTSEESTRTTIIAPASSFVVAGSLPATTLAVPSVGALPADAAVVFATGEPIVSVSVLASTAELLEPGFAAEMNLGDGPVALTLDRIGEPDEEGGVELAFRAESAGALTDALGDETVVLITRSVVAEDALLVPSSAVASRGDARYVLRESGDGDFTEVRVNELGTLDGTSAIEPTEDDSLAVDDHVRIP